MEKISLLLKKPSLGYNFGLYRIFVYSLFFIIYLFHFNYIEYETMNNKLASIFCVILMFTSVINILGFKFKIFSSFQFIINSIFFLLLYDSNTNIFFYEYHVGHNLFFLLFLNILLPLEKSLSIDSLNNYKTKYVAYGYYLFFYLIIGAFYFYAFLYKSIDIHYYDKYFLNFLVIKTESLISVNNLFLNTMDFLNLGYYSGYIILIYQFLMLPILLFLKNSIIKNYYLVFSLLIHITFILFFNVFLLTLIVLAMYIPLFNSRFFIMCLKKLKNKSNLIIIYFDDQCGFCSKTSSLFKIFNFKRNVKLIPLSSNKDIDSNVLTIPIFFNNKYYFGFEGFKILFKNNIILYPFYFLFNIKYLESKYISFATNRKKTACFLPKLKKSKDNIYFCLLIIYILIILFNYSTYFKNVLNDRHYYYEKQSSIYGLLSTQIPIFPFVPSMFIFYNLDSEFYENYVIKKSDGTYLNELKNKEKSINELFFNFEEMKKIKLTRLFNNGDNGNKNIKNKILYVDKLFKLNIGDNLRICKHTYNVNYKEINTKDKLIEYIKNKNYKEECYDLK